MLTPDIYIFYLRFPKEIIGIIVVNMRISKHYLVLSVYWGGGGGGLYRRALRNMRGMIYKERYNRVVRLVLRKIGLRNI